MSLVLLKNWLSAVADKSGFDANFDDEGFCNLSVEGGMLLSVMVSEKQPDHFLLLTVLANLTHDPAVDHLIMKKAMRLNYLQEQTLGGSINIGPNPGVLNYILSYPFAGCDHVGFENVMENYLQAAIELKEQLSNFVPGDTVGATDTGDALPNHAMKV